MNRSRRYYELLAIETLKKFEGPAMSPALRGPRAEPKPSPRPIETARPPKRASRASPAGNTFAHLSGPSLGAIRETVAPVRRSETAIAASWQKAFARVADPLATKPAITNAAAQSWATAHTKTRIV
jgi:hypothetical protein